MNRGKGPFTGLVMAFLLASATTPLAAATVNVFAAASLTDCLRKIASDYEHATGDRIVFNFGASSFLARQIEEGAPADIFFAADEANMDALDKRGLILKQTRASRLSNALVIVVTADSTMAVKSAKELTESKVTRIALADPQTVPAGMYAKQYLEAARLWTAVEAKVIPTDNVRAALAAVESGNVEVGIVYQTDAAISNKVKVTYEIPASETPSISYPMAALKEAREPEAAHRFLKYLGSDEADRVFLEFGFIVRQ